MILANRFQGYTFRNASGVSGITIGLREAAAEVGLVHHGWHDIGSTWFGPAHRIIRLSKLTVSIAKYLRFFFFGPGTPCRCATCSTMPKICEWGGGGPYGGTLLLYSQELAMNHLWSQEEFDKMATQGHIVDLSLIHI